MARAVWIVVFLVTAGLLTVSIPGHYEALETVCKAEPCVAGQLAPEEMRTLGDLGLSVQFNAVYRIALDLMVAAGFCAVSLIIFWRKPNDGGALFVSFALMVFGLTWPDIFDSARFNPVWGWLAGFLTQLGLTSLFVFFFVFPDGRFVPRWTRWIVPLVLVTPVIALLFPGSLLVEPPRAINLSGFVALWVCCLLAQIYRYRRVSGVVQRQQTKWLVFGVTVMVALIAVFLLPLAAFPELARPGTTSLVLDLAGLTVAGSFGFLLIPLSIGVALLRYRLYDIDVIINRTLVYASLTLSLTVTYFGCVAALGYVLRMFTGGGSQLAIVASTLAIAALFVPLRRRLQAFVDRRFYRQKYDAARVLDAFSARLRDETDLGSLSRDLVQAVRETMQPEHVSLWLRPPEGRR